MVEASIMMTENIRFLLRGLRSFESVFDEMKEGRIERMMI